MTGKTHSAIGVATTLAVYKPTKPIDYIPIVFFALIGSLLPDIDLKKSKAGKTVSKLNNVFFILILSFIISLMLDKLLNIDFAKNIFVHLTGIKFFWVGIGSAIFIYFFAQMVQSSHRGFTHSILAAVAISIMSFSFLTVHSAVALSLSYAMHIIADLLNKKGCQLFYPSKKRLCLGLCNSNNSINALLFTLSIVVIVFLMWQDLISPTVTLIIEKINTML